MQRAAIRAVVVAHRRRPSNRHTAARHAVGPAVPSWSFRVPGASAGTVVSSPAMTCPSSASTDGRSNAKTWPFQSARVCRATGAGTGGGMVDRVARQVFLAAARAGLSTSLPMTGSRRCGIVRLGDGLLLLQILQRQFELSDGVGQSLRGTAEVYPTQLGELGLQASDRRCLHRDQRPHLIRQSRTNIRTGINVAAGGTTNRPSRTC